ncbi:hypothetical protein pb186bvf_016661 [Paramecium bursaria]
MEQLILGTLLKYNEIFDALQKIFTLHNYNPMELRQKISQFLDVKPGFDCIYITMNDIANPFTEQAQQIEKDLISLVGMEKKQTEDYIDSRIEQAMNLMNEQIQKVTAQEELRQQEQIVNFDRQYIKRQELKEHKQTMSDKFQTINEQFELQKHIFAYKTYTETNISDIREQLVETNSNIIQQRQSNIQIMRNIEEIRQQLAIFNNRFSDQIQGLNQNVTIIKEQIKQIDQIKMLVNSQQDDNYVVSNKVKALSQMFQDLEVNNNKSVQFEIHGAMKKVDEQMLIFEYKQQSFQNQLAAYKDQIDKFNDSFDKYKSKQEIQADTIFSEVKQQKRLYKEQASIIENINQILQAQPQSVDFLTKINTLTAQIKKLSQYQQGIFKKFLKTYELLLDFCQTSQVPSDNQSKDITNLIILMDRQLMEMSRMLQGDTTPPQVTLVKMQTPRLSTSLESPYRIHSQRWRQKPHSQTISFK